MPHIYADIEYLVFSFWLEPVKVEYYKYSWDFAAIFFDWEESQKGSVHKTGLLSAKSHIRYAATLHLDYKDGKPYLRPTFDKQGGK